MLLLSFFSSRFLARAADDLDGRKRGEKKNRKVPRRGREDIAMPAFSLSLTLLFLSALLRLEEEIERESTSLSNVIVKRRRGGKRGRERRRLFGEMGMSSMFSLSPSSCSC